MGGGGKRGSLSIKADLKKGGLPSGEMEIRVRNLYRFVLFCFKTLCI